MSTSSSSLEEEWTGEYLELASVVKFLSGPGQGCT